MLFFSTMLLLCRRLNFCFAMKDCVVMRFILPLPCMTWSCSTSLSQFYHTPVSCCETTTVYWESRGFVNHLLWHTVICKKKIDDSANHKNFIAYWYYSYKKSIVKFVNFSSAEDSHYIIRHTSVASGGLDFMGSSYPKNYHTQVCSSSTKHNSY